ncbi:MAG: glutathione S-transferase N-terminal domain-containing protein [Gammaproteobacteria bacterium]
MRHGTLLYQFPISHYFEKARWALDYNQVPYATKNLLPGLHLRTLRNKVNDTTLPVLRMNGEYIQGSDRIIDFLEKSIPGNTLTPTDPGQRDDADRWESFASTELAAPFSVFFYSHIIYSIYDS